MIAWVAFKYRGIEYDLTHLHPTQVQFVQPGTDNQPEIIYTVEVHYSLHCFSKKLEFTTDSLLKYSDARETRAFDFVRYEFSKQLPQIIKCLHQKKCMHTEKGNFFVVEVSMPNGVKQEYEVYFDVQRSSTKGVARLYVQSAYVRDTRHGNKPPTTKKISMFVILHHKLAGKQIKIQP